MKKIILLLFSSCVVHFIASGGPKDHPVELKSPKDEKVFTPDEVINEISFKWTAWKSKPKEQVTYRLKIWQLLSGQHAARRNSYSKIKKTRIK